MQLNICIIMISKNLNEAECYRASLGSKSLLKLVKQWSSTGTKRECNLKVEIASLQLNFGNQGNLQEIKSWEKNLVGWSCILGDCSAFEILPIAEMTFSIA